MLNNSLAMSHALHPLLKVLKTLLDGRTSHQALVPGEEVGVLRLDFILHEGVAEDGEDGVPRNEGQIGVGAEEGCVSNWKEEMGWGNLTYHLSPTRYSLPSRILSRTWTTRTACSL